MSRMGDEIEIHRDLEVVYSLGLRHSLLLFWVRSWKNDHFEVTIDANRSPGMIGCDEEDATKLLRYWTHFANSTISYTRDIHKGVIARVGASDSPEMSPNIKYYSEDEYPHRHFALSCGILSSFCFPFYSFSLPAHGVMEIVSTRNQDVGTVETLCKSLKDCGYTGFNLANRGYLLQEYAKPVLGRLLEAVCQRFHLPLTQFWCYYDDVYCLLYQFSDSDSENLAPWCQFKDACLRYEFTRLLGDLYGSHGAYFCRNISALSITNYPFAHYAQNCGSIALFSIHLEKEEEEYVLEFFLPSQEMDNDYPQSLLTSIWTTVRDSLLNYKFSLRGGEIPEQVLSVKVINSSTQTELESFGVGHPQSSLPHYEGSELTRTLKLFEKGPDQSSNSNSYEEAAAGETSIRILHEASEPRRSEEYSKAKGKTMAAERDEPVEGSIIEEASYVISNVDIQNAIATASEPSRFQTKKTLCQQQETMVLENEGDTTQQLPRISPPLFDNGTEQDEQVLEIQKRATYTYSYDEFFTATASKRTPGCVEQMISLDELEELPTNCNEPQSLTSRLRRSKVIFGDEGYTVPSEKVDNPVDVSPDEDVEYAVTTASKRLKRSKIPCTVENISKHFGTPIKDAAESFGVSVSTFKRRCRKVGISWWQPGKSKIKDGEPGGVNLSSGMSNMPKRHVNHSSQDFNTMSVKITYNAVTIRFELTSSSGIAELENSVIERLRLDRKSFSLKYQDDEDDWISITCDKDVQECIKISRSQNKPTIRMELGPPITNYSA